MKIDWRCAIIIEQALYTIIGQRIRSFREKNEWTQDVLGEKVGLTRSSIANIELGKQKVPLGTVYLFAQILSIEIFEILPTLKEINNSNLTNLHLILDTEKYSDAQLTWVSEVIKKGLNEENNNEQD